MQVSLLEIRFIQMQNFSCSYCHFCQSKANMSLNFDFRLNCSNFQTVQLKKSTQLMTFYGTKATSDWQEIKHQNRWENVFDFRMLKPHRKDFDFETYNKTTACVDNAVRVTVGCPPDGKHIYETEFHIKISFIVH